MTSNQFSELFNVHPVRIRKVMGKLKKAGYIDSKQGFGGGFIIACDLKGINLGDIYHLIQDDFMKAKCHTCCSSCKIGVNIENIITGIISGAEGKFQDYLAQYTLKRVLDMLE